MKAHLLNLLAQNQQAISGSGGGGSSSDELDPPFYNTTARSGNPYSIPCIVSYWPRQNNSPNGGWSSSGYWTTFYGYQSSTNDAIQKYGFARPFAATKGSYTNGTYSHDHHKLIYAKNKSVGFCGNGTQAGGSSTNYMPISFLLMYIKNVSNSTAALNIYSTYSNYWSSGHDGSSCIVWYPNTATKSNVSSVSYSTIWSRTSSNSVYSDNGSFSVSPGMTVAVIQSVTNQYHTTFSSGTHATQINLIHNLQTTFNSSFEPDYEMTASVMMQNTHSMGGSYYTSTSHIANDWVRCAELFGN